MSSTTQPIPATVADARGGRPAASTSVTRDRRRKRALIVTGAITLGSIGLVLDLLLVGHTNGEEAWGPVVAGMSAAVGALGMAYVYARGSSRKVRFALYALFLTVAFFGYGGYQSHRLPLPEGTVDARTRPPLAPLTFTGFGLAGAFALHYASKKED